jgi:pyruvate formate lyase activating enzyme
MKALIGNIVRGTRHDGPGIRTTVFFKGCPLNCPWCHNPELIASGPEILFYPDRCIGCGDCAHACTLDAISREASGTSINRRRCTGCGDCALICPTQTLELVGRFYDLDELLDILLRDQVYYTSSGGGVTFSGGEPTLQMDFLMELLRRLHKEGIHTVLETNGYFSMTEFNEKCLHHLDLIYFDLKFLDSNQHKKITGKSNKRIWANLADIHRRRPEVVISRVPVIPGYTATKRNLVQIAARLKEMGIRHYTLLPYHPFGLSKAEHLGRLMPTDLPAKPMTQASLKRWQDVFQNGAAASAATVDQNRDNASLNQMEKEVGDAN